MVDQQALRAKNYVGTTEIASMKCRKFFKGCPINLHCAPMPPLSGIWGARAPASSVAPAPMPLTTTGEVKLQL